MTLHFQVPTPSGPRDFSISPGASMIFVGANGGGKTRLSVHIEQTNLPNIHRISAHRALALNPDAPKISEELAKIGLLTGYASKDSGVSFKSGHRWGNNKWATHLLDDFDFVVQGLFAEQNNTALDSHNAAHAGSIENLETTKFQILNDIWKRLLPHRQLVITGDNINVKINAGSIPYSASEMSDGERAIFYLIGQTLLAVENSVLIVDEPELHVHRSIMSKLWDELEASRPDCAFIFITHDLEFAASRIAEKYIICEYAPDIGWTIETVPNDTGFDEEIATLILGSRRPVLFVEGEAGSLDIAIYRSCYPDTTVIARGGCQDVIHSVASMRKNAQLHRVKCAGIIDADGRSAADSATLSELGIETLCVSEIENLFLLPSISRAILIAENFSGDEVDNRLGAIKAALFSGLNSDTAIENVVLRWCRRRIDAKLKKLDLSAALSADDLKSLYALETNGIDIEQLAAEARSEIDKAIASQNLESLLKIYDNKGLLALAAQHLSGRSLGQFKGWLTRSLKSDQTSSLRVAVLDALPVLTLA